MLSVLWPRNLPTLRLWVTLCFLEECFKVLFFKVLCYVYYICLNSNQGFDCFAFSLSFSYAPTWPMAWSHSACTCIWVLHMQARLEYLSLSSRSDSRQTEEYKWPKARKTNTGCVAKRPTATFRTCLPTSDSLSWPCPQPSLPKSYPICRS